MIDFFEFSNEMLCIADHRGFFTRVNQAWTKTLGWSADELTSRPFVDFVHPDDLAATIQEATLLQSGSYETVSFENRYRCRDGSYRWLAWRSVLAPSTRQLVATARDISEQKLQAQALAESEERFRAFMENSPAYAWAKDEQGRFVYVNKAFAERFNTRPDEWLGKTDFEIWPKEIAQDFWESDRKVLANGEPILITEESVSAGNKRRYWFKSKFLFKDGGSKPFVGGVGIDVTELKRTEESLRSEQDLLGNMIVVQEEEKQFLCHEFHDGLIQYAAGSLMLLEGYRNNRPCTEDLSIIDLAIDNLRRGVEDGRRVIRGIRPAVLDDSGLEAAMDDLVGQFTTLGLLVTSKCDPEIGRLPDMIQTTIYRVVQEALNNARKHSGTDVVRIELKKVNGDLLLEILDFGCGFDVESARIRGFGLVGMTRRVQFLGGECLIESNLDAGTRISVRLPIPVTQIGGD